MKSSLAYLALFTLLCGTFGFYVHERAENIRLNDELTIVGSKIPVYAQATDEMSHAADEAMKKLAACEERKACK